MGRKIQDRTGQPNATGYTHQQPAKDYDENTGSRSSQADSIERWKKILQGR